MSDQERVDFVGELRKVRMELEEINKALRADANDRSHDRSRFNNALGPIYASLRRMEGHLGIESPVLPQHVHEKEGKA